MPPKNSKASKAGVGNAIRDTERIGKKRISSINMFIPPDVDIKVKGDVMSGRVRPKTGKAKPTRKKTDILSLVDQGIAMSPTEIAKRKVDEAKAARDAPVPDLLPSEKEKPAPVQKESQKAEPAKETKKTQSKPTSKPKEAKAPKSSKKEESSKESKSSKKSATKKETTETRAGRSRDKSPKSSEKTAGKKPRARSRSTNPKRNKSVDAKRDRLERKKEKAAAASSPAVAPAAAPAPPPHSTGKYTLSGFKTNKSAEEVRQELDEVQKKLKNVPLDKQMQLADMKTETDAKKKELDNEFGAQIEAERKANAKQNKTHQQLHDEAQKITEKLREENKRLRAQKDKYPKQIKDVSALNDGLTKSNKEVSNHFESLTRFAKKMTNDHNRLQKSNDECKEKYLPRYRTELRERKDYIDTETRIKDKYRDTMIKLCNRVIQTRHPKLIEQISTMVIEIEGELNPKFDPKILFADESDESDNGSDSDSDDDSDSGSD
jgi:hypothetical protein